MPTPYVGLTVLYRPMDAGGVERKLPGYKAPKGGTVAEHAAIVTAVIDETTVNLTVFYDGQPVTSSSLFGGVAYAEAGQGSGNSWRFIEAP